MLSLSMGCPTPEKITEVVERCRNSDARQLWGVLGDGRVLGVAMVYVREDNTLYICNISVVEECRGQGIGRAMIDALHDMYGLPITLETDDDTVDFYRKCGFEAEAYMHEEYGVRRWRCRMQPVGAACQPPEATILTASFYQQDVLLAAPALLGKLLCRRLGDGTILRGRITETEAYRGADDSACHASRGRTPRNAVMFRPGGACYVYLCYGVHSLLNVITGGEGEPQGALIRGIEGAVGPGRVTKALQIDRALNGLDLIAPGPLWIEDDGFSPEMIRTGPRVGIAYASAEDQARPWRFFCESEGAP